MLPFHDVLEDPVQPGPDGGVDRRRATIPRSRATAASASWPSGCLDLPRPWVHSASMSLRSGQGGGGWWSRCSPARRWRRGSSAAAPVGEVTRFTEGFAGRPVDLSAGPDGNVWFTDPAFDKSGVAPTVGRITPGGAVTTFGIGLPRSGETYARLISAGPDARIWFTLEGAAPGIGRINLNGAGTTFFRQGLAADPAFGQIGPGFDGNLWLTDIGPTPAIVRVTPAGAITEFTLSEPPQSLTPGPDGNLWFTLPESARAIGRITPSGTITTFGPGGDSRPSVIVAGADGNLWFTDAGGSFPFESPRIGRITPTGTITSFDGLLPGSMPGGLTLGPDGNVWFTDFASVYTNGRPKIGRVTPAGAISQFTTCLRTTPGDGPRQIIAAPDGNVWFSHDTRRSLPSIGPVPSIARVAPDGSDHRVHGRNPRRPRRPQRSAPTAGSGSSTLGCRWRSPASPRPRARPTSSASPAGRSTASGARRCWRLDLPPAAVRCSSGAPRWCRAGSRREAAGPRFASPPSGARGGR